jgi:hypothetical protein
VKKRSRNNASCPKCGSQNVIPRQEVTIAIGAESAGDMILRLHERHGVLKRKLRNYPMLFVAGPEIKSVESLCRKIDQANEIP